MRPEGGEGVCNWTSNSESGETGETRKKWKWKSAKWEIISMLWLSCGQRRWWGSQFAIGLPTVRVGKLEKLRKSESEKVQSGILIQCIAMLWLSCGQKVVGESVSHGTSKSESGSGETEKLRKSESEKCKVRNYLNGMTFKRPEGGEGVSLQLDFQQR